MKHSTKTTIRTVVQAVTGLAAGLPLLVSAAGIPETAAGVGVALAVAGTVTRVMALPLVQGWLAHLGLSTAPEHPRPGGMTVHLQLNAADEELKALIRRARRNGEAPQ